MLKRSYKAVVAALALAVCATAYGDGELTNTSHDVAKRPSTRSELEARLARLAPEVVLDEGTEGSEIDCRVLDANGDRTNTVVAADFGAPASWLEYVSDGRFDLNVRIVVLPNFEGSPLAGQAQIFTTHDITNVSTPFGVPRWGLDLTTGPWLLIVRNNRGDQAVCPFTVVAQ
jgi:hypothetical protein